MTEILLLRAEEPDDLILLSACVQDMAVRAGDIVWQQRQKRLTLLGNRFRWESASLGPKKGGTASRVRSALRFDFIEAVRRRNWPANPETVLALLAITFDDDEGALVLTFADGVALSVRQEVLDATMEDLSGPWGASTVPDHDEA